MTTQQLFDHYRAERQITLNSHTLLNKVELDDDGEPLKNNDWISMQIKADEVNADLKYLEFVLSMIAKRKDREKTLRSELVKTVMKVINKTN